MAQGVKNYIGQARRLCLLVNPSEFFIDDNIRVVFRNILVSDMNTLPSQPRNLTHSQGAGKRKIDCDKQLSVGAVVQSLPDNIYCPDCPYLLFLFRQQHIIKGIFGNHVPANRLPEGTVHDLTDFLNRAGRQGLCPDLAEGCVDWRCLLKYKKKVIHDPAVDVLDVILTQDWIDIVVN